MYARAVMHVGSILAARPSPPRVQKQKLYQQGQCRFDHPFPFRFDLGKQCRDLLLGYG